MRKSKVLTKALAAILCIAMLIPMAVTVGAAETGSEPQATISVSTKRLSMDGNTVRAFSGNNRRCRRGNRCRCRWQSSRCRSRSGAGRCR